MLDCDISGPEIQVTAVMMIGFTPPTFTPRCLQYFATVTLNLPDYDTRYISDLISLHCPPQTEAHCQGVMNVTQDVPWQIVTVMWRNVTEDVTQDRILISNRPEVWDQVILVIKNFLGVNSYHRNNSGPVSCLVSVEEECSIVGSGAIRRDSHLWNSNENMRQVPSERQRTEHFHMRRDRQMWVDTGLLWASCQTTYRDWN